MEKIVELLKGQLVEVDAHAARLEAELKEVKATKKKIEKTIKDYSPKPAAPAADAAPEQTPEAIPAPVK